MHIYIYIHIHTYIHIYIYICIHTYRYRYICIISSICWLVTIELYAVIKRKEINKEKQFRTDRRHERSGGEGGQNVMVRWISFFGETQIEDTRGFSQRPDNSESEFCSGLQRATSQPQPHHTTGPRDFWALNPKDNKLGWKDWHSSPVNLKSPWPLLMIDSFDPAT